MAFSVVLPRLGWSMESGRVVEWLKKDGEAVQAGDMIFSVEGDKAVQEVEALDSGILRILPDTPSPEQEVKVGTLLAYICQPGEEPPFASGSTAEPGTEKPAVETGSTPNKVEVAAVSQAPDASGSIEQVAISPRARRVAKELAVDWMLTRVQGTGITGRIRERDIRAAAAELVKTPAPTGLTTGASAQVLVGEQKSLAGKSISIAGVEIPMAVVERNRSLETGRLFTSLSVTAPVTLMTEIDATALYQLHQKWQNNADLAGQPIPTTTDMLVKLTAQALSEHPEMNASLEGNVILRRKSISIGLTLDNDAGVIIPVVKDANYKSLRQIANESAVFAEKENAGSLSQDDCGGSTFSVIDLGMTDVDFFTPVINLPECAILGIGRIKNRPSGRSGRRHNIYPEGNGSQPDI